MANNCKVDFITKEIRVTKSFYKAAQNVGTEEFCTMIRLQEKLPSFSIVFQHHAAPTCKVWYPTYEQMMNYISCTAEDDESSIAELKDIIKLSRATCKGYNMVRAWFMNHYSEAMDVA